MLGWAGVLPLLAAALAATVPTPPPQELWNLQDAVNLQNIWMGSDNYMFRLVDTDVAEVSTNPTQLHFKIMETECQRKLGIQNAEKCEFKNYGVVRECTATMSKESPSVACKPMIQKTQIRRPRHAKECTAINKKRERKKGKWPSKSTALLHVSLSR